MRKPRQRIKFRRWEGIHSNAKYATGIGPLAKQKAGLALAMDPRVVGSTLKVGLLLLDAYNTNTGLCYWAIENIAGELSMGRRSVFRALQTLKKCGYLDWERHKGFSYTNLYSWNWQVLFSEAEENGASLESEQNESERVTQMASPVPDMAQTSALDGTQIREEKDNKKEYVTTNQKEAWQKQEGRRKPARTHQSSQFGLRTFSVVKGGYDAATTSGTVAYNKASERVQKAFSENSLWDVAMKNNGAYEAAILAEIKKPGTCLQAFNAALEQSAEDPGELALCQ